MKKGILISELSRRVALPTPTIRYYERIGLLNPPQRTQSRYRVYSDAAEERLRFIQKAKQFGLSLDEIKRLIDIKAEGSSPCADLKQMVKQHLEELDQHIQDMQTFRQILAQRYKQIEAALPDSTQAIAGENCSGKICRLVEQAPTN
jgi:DNA-binding transcriptional MerR regulator